MATLKNKFCPKHGVYDSVEHKQCPNCKRINVKKIADTRDKEQKSVYNKKKWQEVRRKALARDGYECVMCKANGISVKQKLEVDHIKELKDGGAKYDLNNLQTLCVKHHVLKTNIEKRKRNEL